VTPQAISVLLVEDSPGDARLVELYLEQAQGHNFDITHVTCLKDAEGALLKSTFNAVLLDLALPDSLGSETLNHVIVLAPHSAVVVMTGIYNAELATQAIHAGAQDYLVKGEADAAILERTLINATERAEFRNTARREKERYLAVVETANDAIFTVNAKGKILTWNRAASEIFGCTYDDMIEQPLWPLFSATARKTLEPTLDAYLRDARLKPKHGHVRLNCIHNNHQSFPAEVSMATWHTDEGNFASIVVRDITETQKADRLKSEFVSTVSHELRTPLTSLMGSLKLVAGGVTGELPDKAKVLLEIAVNNGDRLILLINDILDMNKIESGRIDFNMASTELIPIVEEAVAQNFAYAAKLNVSIVIQQTLKNTDLKVTVDKDRLLQVLANLLSNAAKYSPDQGVIQVSVSQHDNTVQITVTDNGPGIPDDFRDRIFHKFAQADSTDTRQKGGTGLGLSITKALVEKMRGRIDYRSTPDVETAFYIKLPIHH